MLHLLSAKKGLPLPPHRILRVCPPHEMLRNVIALALLASASAFAPMSGLPSMKSARTCEYSRTHLLLPARRWRRVFKEEAFMIP